MEWTEEQYYAPGSPVLNGQSNRLYPLELSCDRQRPHPAELNPQAPPFRPRRDAAVAASLRVQNIAQDEE